jgi:hypothetical protein
MLACAHALGRPPLPRLFVVSGFVHVSQDPLARLDLAPLARIDKVQAQFLNGVRDFSHASRQRSGNRRTAFAAVYRSQWLDPPLCLWNDGLTSRAKRTRKQPIKPFRREVWQIASHDQIPAPLRCGQGGGNARQRPSVGRVWTALGLPIALVRDCAESERGISAGRSDDRYLGDQWFEQSGHMKDQRHAPEIEEALVAAHARAGAPCKDEPSGLLTMSHASLAILRRRVVVAQHSGET